MKNNIMFCTKCKNEFTPIKNDVKVKVGVYTGVHRADLYGCKCDTYILSGFGREDLDGEQFEFEVG